MNYTSWSMFIDAITTRFKWMVYVILVILIQLASRTEADVFCGIENGFLNTHVTYCYGITAYCCGFREDRCCWNSIWKVWWFWVVVLVVLGALFSCIGYFCTCMSDDWSSSGRASPLYAIRDGFRRRFSSTPGSTDGTDPYKDYRDRGVVLPPYYPSTSTVPVAGSSSYPDAPPPYTEQPTTESTPLLPVSTTTSVVNAPQPQNNQTLNRSTTQR